eukprot:COSAG02_NODE_3465_length_6695_cov_3.210734_1_plen_78_part_00
MLYVRVCGSESTARARARANLRDLTYRSSSTIAVRKLSGCDPHFRPPYGVAYCSGRSEGSTRSRWKFSLVQYKLIGP